MAMRYLTGKLRAPVPAAALRRPRSLSANASQGEFSKGSTTELASSTKEIRQLRKELAKMEAASKEIEKTIRYNIFRRCIVGSVVLGLGLAGVSCVYFVGLEMENKYSPRSPN
uniref:Uncharacterized protein n=1 Tax=Oryza punctata TaxID=4537 RepID=A0A0E0LH83_ORYPU